MASATAFSERHRVRMEQIPLRLRWLIAMLFSGLSYLALSYGIREPAERFWMLIPWFVFLFAYCFRTIPPPRMAQQNRWSRRLTYVLLPLFPIGFYSALVWICQSPYSWAELTIVVYFFVFAIELPLLYFFNVMEFLEGRLKGIFPEKFGWFATILIKGCGYLVLFPILLTVFAIHRPKLLPSEFQFISPAQVQPVSFPSREDNPLTLRGEFLTHPDAKRTILICHGVGANRTDISAIVKIAYQASFHVLTFDFRGHGESDGHTITYGWREKRDIQGAYDFLQDHPQVDSEKLYAIGVSMGGSSLLMALPEMPKVKAAFVDSSYADLELMIHHQLRFFPAPIRFPMVSLARIVGWLETGHDLAAVQPVDSLSQVDIPLTIVHGRDDPIVPFQHANILKERTSHLHSFHAPDEVGHIGTAIVTPWRYKQVINNSFAAESLTFAQ